MCCSCRTKFGINPTVLRRAAIFRSIMEYYPSIFDKATTCFIASYESSATSNVVRVVCSEIIVVAHTVMTYLLGRNLSHKSHYLHYPRDSKARYLHNTSSRKTRPANVVEQLCISNVHDGLSLDLYSTTQRCNSLRKTQQTSTAAPIRNSSWGPSTSGRKKHLPNHRTCYTISLRAVCYTLITGRIYIPQSRTSNIQASICIPLEIVARVFQQWK